MSAWRDFGPNANDWSRGRTVSSGNVTRGRRLCSAAPCSPPSTTTAYPRSGPELTPSVARQPARAAAGSARVRTAARPGARISPLSRRWRPARVVLDLPLAAAGGGDRHTADIRREAHFGVSAKRHRVRLWPVRGDRWTCWNPTVTCRVADAPRVAVAATTSRFGPGLAPVAYRPGAAFNYITRSEEWLSRLLTGSSCRRNSEVIRGRPGDHPNNDLGPISLTSTGRPRG